jgi:hypothetical protein
LPAITLCAGPVEEAEIDAGAAVDSLVEQLDLLAWNPKLERVQDACE